MCEGEPRARIPLPSSAEPRPAPLQPHRTQLRCQRPSRPSVQKPRTTLRLPNVSGRVSAGAREHPPGCHSTNFSPCAPTTPGCCSRLPCRAPSLRERAPILPRAPSSGPAPGHSFRSVCLFSVYLFVCLFLRRREFVYKIDSWPFETNCY